MAVVKIYIEGGVVPHANDSALTINNSQRLREAFYKLIVQKLDHYEFKLEIEMSGGWFQAKQSWLKSLESNANTLLLIDLDVSPGKEKERLEKLAIDEKNAQLVFFMTREMEAWFLDQPQIFEATFKNCKRIKLNDRIADDGSILNKDIRSIPNPSNVVKIILGRYFRIERNRKSKKMKYNKLREGADLIENLDIDQVLDSFPSFKKLIERLLSSSKRSQ